MHTVPQADESENVAPQDIEQLQLYIEGDTSIAVELEDIAQEDVESDSEVVHHDASGSGDELNLMCLTIVSNSLLKENFIQSKRQPDQTRLQQFQRMTYRITVIRFIFAGVRGVKFRESASSGNCVGFSINQSIKFGNIRFRYNNFLCVHSI